MKFMKLSSQFIDKFTRVSTLPAHHADLIQKVSILKDELLSMGNSKEKFESVFVTAFTFFTHLSLLSLYYCKSNKVIPSHGLHPGYRSLV
ncbi:hypothetical protein Bca4012_029961 [Brassica carinata]